jgi:hypothetical protein
MRTHGDEREMAVDSIIDDGMIGLLADEGTIRAVLSRVSTRRLRALDTISFKIATEMANIARTCARAGSDAFQASIDRQLALQNIADNVWLEVLEQVRGPVAQ